MVRILSRFLLTPKVEVSRKKNVVFTPVNTLSTSNCMKNFVLPSFNSLGGRNSITNYLFLTINALIRGDWMKYGVFFPFDFSLLAVKLKDFKKIVL